MPPFVKEKKDDGKFYPLSLNLYKDQSQSSLYERLRGVYAIAPVVDDFLTRVNQNDILNAHAAIHDARKRASSTKGTIVTE